MILTPSDVKILNVNKRNGNITVSVLQWSKIWHYIGELQGELEGCVVEGKK